MIAELPKILPCPFCGDTPTPEGDYAYGVAVRHPDPLNDANHTSWDVSCFNDACPAEPRVDGATQSEAIAAWNTRAPA